MASYEQKLKEVQRKFQEGMNRTNGVISKSMNVDTKPNHKFHYNGYLITIDSKMPEQEFLELKQHLNQSENAKHL
jgi:hypothetical protein